MMRLIHSQSRRRVMLTVVCILLTTVAMIGPTQAVSGIVTASVAVMETFNEVLRDGDGSTKSIAAIEPYALPEWSDTPLTPDFSGIVGTLPPQPESELSASIEALPAAITAGDQGNTQNASGLAGGGWSGNRSGHAGASGLGAAGGGGGGSAGAFAGTTAGRELAAMDLALESSEASLGAGGLDDAIIEGFGGAPLDLLDPVGAGPAPGSNPGGSSSIPGVALGPPDNPYSPSPLAPSLAGDPTLSIADGTTPSANGGPGAGGPAAPSVNDVPSPAVIDDLLDDLGVPPAVSANLDPLRSAGPALNSEGGILQIPEPSMVLLGAVGVAAVARRYRRRNADRRP